MIMNPYSAAMSYSTLLNCAASHSVTCAVSTPSSDKLLAEREGPAEGKGWLEGTFVRVFDAVSEYATELLQFFNSFFSNDDVSKSESNNVAFNGSSVLDATLDQLGLGSLEVQMKKTALLLSLKSLAKVIDLNMLESEDLKEQHRLLATNNGVIRLVVTALASVEKCSDSSAERATAESLLAREIGGAAFKSWGTTEGPAVDFLRHASSDDLKSATEGLKSMVDEILQLKSRAEQRLNSDKL